MNSNMNPIKESLQEIERKFTVKQVPENLEQYSHDDIKQGYYLDEEVNIEFRLRQKTEKFYKTYKIGSGLIREEFETEISKDDFENSWPLTKNKRLEKIRYYIPYGEHTIELDVYKGNLEGLKVAEVEFESEDDAVKFVAPDWFDQDVTEKEEYKNSNLAEKNTKEKPYSLEEGLEKLTSLVKEKLQEKDGTIIVEIAGGSSSGKTSAVSVKLKEMFGDDAMIFSMDDYYRGRTYMAIEAEKGNVLNFDQPEVLNLPLLKEHINQLKSGQSIQKPIYSFKEGEAVGTEELKPKRIIIVEGLFALNEQLIDEGDVKAFVDIGTHGRIMRRLLRDVERTGQRPEDILNYFSEVVEPMHDKYIQTTAKNADIIISNEYNPKIEADRANAEEIQVKYPLISVDYELIRKIGAERLSSSNQTDIYYNPKDKDLSTTGESLRIREESGRKILTYKGPKKDTSIRQRPKFEFQIDDDTESKFLDIYGDKVKVVNKQRDVYQYKSLVFTIDSVSDITDGKDRFIGSFVELRLQDVNPDNQIVNELIEKLSLNPEDAINKSYLEM